ncbi:hypothetical protein EON79_04510 [bacterium]|nr:MAG: hypothetical protein EON79_04510 [bacterium]
MLTLRYFGSFEIRRDQEEIALPTRPCARLLALLATEPGRRWRRESVAAEIWPDAEYRTDTVSLRTALVMLRRTLGTDAIGSDRERVWVEPSSITTDRDRFAALQRREGLETDSDRHEATLVELAETPADFLSEWDASWTVPLRQDHARAVARAALELSRLRLASGRYEEARRLALRSLAARPGNEGAIVVAVRAAAAMGDRDEALELAARTGGSPELRRLAKEIGSAPAIVPAPVPAPDFLFDAFESNLREDPEGAVRFLLSNAQFWWRQREFARAKELLRLALNESSLGAALRIRALYVLAFLNERTSHYPEAFEAIERIEQTPGDDAPEHILLARSLKGFLLYEVRRYDESRAIFDELVGGDSGTMDPGIATYAYANRAGLNWQLLRLEEGRADYRAARERITGDGFRNAYLRANVDANLACIAHVEGDWESAHRLAASAREILTVRTDTLVSSMADSISILARVAQGQTGLGARLGRAPMELVRCGMRRMALVVFDHVVEGLAILRHGEAARSLAHATEELRATLGHVRSPAEERCIGRAMELARQQPGARVPPAPTGGYAELATWTAARGDKIAD